MYEEGFAYSFECDLNLSTLLESLNAEGTRKWILRDSYWYGDYISSIQYREYEGDEEEEEEKLKIYEEDESYTITVFFSSNQPGAEEKWKSLHNYVVKKLFPLIGARNIMATEFYD